MDNKKQKAAIAGVMQYLKSEAAQMPIIEPAPRSYPGPWPSYSRQLMMMNRNGLQRRVVKR
jgi:hypothetical protein